MEEKALFNICLVCALVGVLIILFISERRDISDSDISNITRDHIDKEVRIKGYVTFSRDLPGILIMTVKDNTGNITVVAFKEDQEIKLEQGQVVEVKGIVKEYQYNLEIEASSIKII